MVLRRRQKNISQGDCALSTSDVIVKKISVWIKNKFPTTGIFRIFVILKINHNTQFCNLFIQRPL